ncbi:MAG: STAS domain-containing protein [Planctomycetaceae bacterium]|nr:STAS domain-containing protein [Planctomycetaceae bacterium]
MLKHLRIFQTQRRDNILVVTPQGDPTAFRYNDLHREANSVRDLLMNPDIRFLVINLQKMEYFGSEFIGSLVSMAREVKNRQGRAAICEANPQMVEVLQNMSLFKLWPYYESEDAAIAALQQTESAE